MKTLIFANGIINDYGFINKYLFDYDFVFCIDGGLNHADAAGLYPNYIIGDFDSVTPELLVKYKKAGVSFVQFAPEKDFTDLEAGLRLAIEKGSRDIIIFGALGGRLDHELANINLLHLALSCDVTARIVSETQVIRLTNRESEIIGRAGEVVSLIPFGGAVSGITTYGLDYPLKNEDLGISESRGVSNVMTGSSARVTIEAGLLLVVENLT